MSEQVNRKNNIAELIRYGLGGLFNTGLNIVLFLTFVEVLGLSPYLGNLYAWIIGIAISFLIQRSLVFKSQGNFYGQLISFGIVACIAYGINLGVLHFCLVYLPVSKEFLAVAAQIFAAASYIISFYLFSKFWVFRR